MKADEIYGTKNPTPHRLLLDARFELPFGESSRPVRSESPPAVTASAASIPSEMSAGAAPPGNI